MAPVTGETGVQYTASEKKKIEEIKQNRNEVKELTSNLPDYKTETAKIRQWKKKQLTKFQLKT